LSEITGVVKKYGILGKDMPGNLRELFIGYLISMLDQEVYQAHFGKSTPSVDKLKQLEVDVSSLSLFFGNKLSKCEDAIARLKSA
jgi:hypothetical protein